MNENISGYPDPCISDFKTEAQKELSAQARKDLQENDILNHADANNLSRKQLRRLRAKLKKATPKDKLLTNRKYKKRPIKKGTQHAGR